jgi:hypothetical protein
VTRGQEIAAVVALTAWSLVILLGIVAVVRAIPRRRRKCRCGKCGPVAAPVLPPLMPDQQVRAREQYADLELAEARTRLAAATEDSTRVLVELVRVIDLFIDQTTKETP